MSPRTAMERRIRVALEVTSDDAHRLLVAMLDVMREEFIRTGHCTVPGMFEVSQSPDGSAVVTIAPALLKERTRANQKS